MKKFAVLLFVGAVMCVAAMDAAAGDVFTGLSIASAQSTGSGVKNSSTGFSGLLSMRQNDHVGLELQAGIFGKSGPFTSNTEVDGALAGFVPLGSSQVSLFGKAGLAWVYSSAGSGITASKLGLTYGGGIEYQHNKSAIRIGFQHFKVGNDALSPALGTNMVGITFLAS